MPTPATAIWRIAVKNWPELVKNGPKVVAAVGALSQFLKDHPDIPTWLRQRLDDVPKRVISVQKRHGDASRIRGNLDIVRDVARDAEKADGRTVQAAGYVARADGIERGVRLAEALARPEQRTALAQLKTRTDALLAELIDAVAQVDAGAPEQVTSSGEQPPA
jgi:hypothetical protein